MGIFNKDRNGDTTIGQWMKLVIMFHVQPIEMFKWNMKGCLFAANWLSFYAHPEELYLINKG